MTIIKCKTYGEVPSNFVDFVIRTLRSFYELVGEGPILVEVLIYGSSSDKITSLIHEANNLGVLVLGLDYVTLHEAWSGWPRIHIDFGACKELSNDIVEALIVHEAVHSILHGSIQYYMINVDNIPEWVSPEDFLKLMYTSVAAVKDYEVCTYLRRKGLIKYVKKYSEFVINEMKKHECLSIQDLLMMLKLITSLLCINENLSEDYVGYTCRDYLKALLPRVKVTLNSNEQFNIKAFRLVDLALNAWLKI